MSESVGGMCNEIITGKLAYLPIMATATVSHRWSSSLRVAEGHKPTNARTSRKDKSSTGIKRQESHANEEEMREIGNQTVRSPLKSKGPLRDSIQRSSIRVRRRRCT